MISLFTFGLGFLLGLLVQQLRHTYLDTNMATVEPNQPQGEMEVCDWCRCAMHHKCIKNGRVTAICLCDCTRGY